MSVSSDDSYTKQDAEDEIEILRRVGDDVVEAIKNVTDELKQLRKRREQGFPEKQKEIRTRHALDVQVSPLILTQVEYERGEIDFELVQNDVTQTVIAGYGYGIGVTEDVNCISCNENFNEENPLQTIVDGLRCKKCTQ